jgi:hypothetical protein
MLLETVTAADLPTIREWISLDDDHKAKPFTDEYFQTGYNFLNFKIVDSEGTVVYVRTEEDPKDASAALLSLQFAPYDIVSKRRLISAITQVFPIFTKELQKTFQKVRFESTQPKLVRFFEHLGFRHDGDDFYTYYFNPVPVA